MTHYTTNSWNPLSLPFDKNIHEAMIQMHHAAQFVAMFGEAYLPKADDDSQSNMEWLPKIKTLAGHQVGKNRVQMTYAPWTIQLLGAYDVELGSIKPEGKTKTEIRDWFVFQLTKTTFPPQQYDFISHFSLPKHPLDKGATFAAIDQDIRHELALYRQNALWILNLAIQPFNKASAVRVWPHHFDSGSIIGLAFDQDANTPTATIGLGWAIPDDEINTPYYYINHWRKEGAISYKNLPKLPEGSHWHQGNWTGPVLPLSSLLKLEGNQQEKLVSDFFDAGIAASKDLVL
ncbi:MAG: hypothetical protein DHS20C18_47930 [Saprospiraceae bacterium]|nr:MAG: hypothetical protein DHS20C18_47930 [Saprospiraceae bacterium]